MFSIEWLDKFVGGNFSPWKMGLLGGLATGGGLVMFALWFCLMALVFQKLWNYVVPSRITQAVFNLPALRYRRTLAGLGLLYIARLALVGK